MTAYLWKLHIIVKILFLKITLEGKKKQKGIILAYCTLFFIINLESYFLTNHELPKENLLKIQKNV